MNALQIEFLLGVYFVVVNVPEFFDNGESKVAVGTVVQFVIGVVLVAMAYFGFAIAHV